MNFFERQHAARGTSLRLVLLFIAAVICIVAAIDLVTLYFVRNQPSSGVLGWLITVTIAMLVIIAGGTASKMVALRAGGAAVAKSVGAVPVDPSTSDPSLRRLINVVEEMSIAAGIPTPRVFVLEQEPGINAFAAGFSPADAAITVTAGALSQLNRDELQGVIGHEFSHVLNGDMRLNVRLIGLLNGILLIGLIGLRVVAFGGGGRGDRKGGNPLIAIALVMTVLGFIGQFFASIIKAAVSRQREWLADASSVQFTRQTTGLEGALKKIAGVPTGSTLKNASGAREVSHMLFGDGESSFVKLFATHPPLNERIAALDPTFQPAQVAALRDQWAAQPPNGLAEDASLGLASRAPRQAAAPAPASAGQCAGTGAGPSVSLAPADVSARVATLTSTDLERGVALSARIPPEIRQLASQASTAVPLVLAMLVSESPEVRDRQLATISSRLGKPEAAQTADLAPGVSGLDPALRLPLVSIAAPLVGARPRAELDALVATLDELAAADGVVTTFEYCLTRMVGSFVRDVSAPAARARPGGGSAQGAQAAAFTLLAVIATAGNSDRTAAEHAFHAAVEHLLPGSAVPYRPPADFRALDPGWPQLDGLAPKYKQALVEAIVVAVRDDGVLTVAEAELLRTACALLHCPLPSLVA